MRPFVQGRQKNLLRTISSNAQAVDNVDMEIETPHPLDAIEQRDMQSPSFVNNSANILQDYLQYKLNKPPRGDHLTKYVKTTEETVRMFPMLLQMSLKRKFQILKALDFYRSSVESFDQEESHQGDNIKYIPPESQSLTV